MMRYGVGRTKVARRAATSNSEASDTVPLPAESTTEPETVVSVTAPSLKRPVKK